MHVFCLLIVTNLFMHIFLFSYTNAHSYFILFSLHINAACLFFVCLDIFSYDMAKNVVPPAQCSDVRGGVSVSAIYVPPMSVVYFNTSFVPDKQE